MNDAQKPVSAHSFYVFCSVVPLCCFFAFSGLLHILLFRFTSVQLLSYCFALYLSLDRHSCAACFGFIIWCISVSLNKSGKILSSFVSCTFFGSRGWLCDPCQRLRKLRQHSSVSAAHALKTKWLKKSCVLLVKWLQSRD